MKYFLRISTALTFLILISLSFIPAIEDASAQPQDDLEDNVLQKTFFYMRKGKLVHPESPEGEDNPISISCPAKTEPFYPRLPGKYIRKYVWTSLPVNFESNSVNAPVNIGYRVQFNLWFEATDGNLGTIRFIFTLLHNGNPIAQTDSAEYNNLNDGSAASITASAGINITGSRLEVGDTLGMHIDYWVNGDGLYIKYDNPLFDSGFEIEGNPIKINHITATPTRISTNYREAFNVRITKLNFIALIDETPVDELPLYTSSKDGPIVYWEHPLQKGTHIITIMISYGSNENESMVIKTQEIEIIVEEPLRFLGLEVNTWGRIIILIIIVAIILTAFRMYRSRREENELLGITNQ
jgi:hypothetical protein